METEIEKTTGQAVFCKCGNIVFASLDSNKEDIETKATILHYWNRGYRIGRVTISQVKELYGCKCDEILLK